MKRILCMLLIFLFSAALAETVQDEALTFIQEAGIAADAVTRLGEEIVVTLQNGGTATLHIPGDFDKYDLNWRFNGATDEDLALYLDHALGLLAALEAKIPADTENLSTAQAIRVRSYQSTVAKALETLAQPDEQRIRVLQAQLALQDESGLEDLRTRLLTMILLLAETATAE